MAETLTLVTAEAFLADPSYEGWELVDGEPKECSMGLKSNATAARIVHLLYVYLDEFPDAGTVFTTDLRLRIWQERPNHIRRPDVAFVREGRIADFDAGELTIAPDLVVEVVSTHDEAEQVEAKRVEYLDGGVPVIWVVYPVTRTVHVYRPGGLAAILSGEDVLTGDEALPGLLLPVASLFPAAR